MGPQGHLNPLDAQQLTQLSLHRQYYGYGLHFFNHDPLFRDTLRKNHQNPINSGDSSLCLRDNIEPADSEIQLGSKIGDDEVDQQ